MESGIRATVVFPNSDLCPVVGASASAATTIDSVSRSVCPSDCADCITEFAVESDCEADVDAERIFSHGQSDRYRFTHSEGVDCPCECLGQFGVAIARYVAREGELTLVFHAADYDQLQDVVGQLQDRFPSADIKRFVRAPTGDHSRQSVLVDRSKLTARQFEVLDTAHEMGYFERPRSANATDVADELDITPATLSEHLVAAQQKLFEDIL